MGNWKFLGSYFTNIETVLAAATPRGSLTPYPIDFTLAEHVANEWKWKTLQLTYDIDIDWSGELINVAGTLTHTPTAGTDWDVLVPSDLATTGSRLFSVGVVTGAPVGVVTACQVLIAAQINKNHVVEGTNTFTREIGASVRVILENAALETDDTRLVTDEDLGSGVVGNWPILGENIDYSMEHFDSGGATADAIITFNDFTLSISDNFTEPADIP